jgi:hypothetical protein
MEGTARQAFERQGVPVLSDAERARAVQTVLQRVNPQREPELHAALFDVYLSFLRPAVEKAAR